MQFSEMLGAERVKIFCESDNVIFASLVNDTVNSVMKKVYFLKQNTSA